MGPDQFVQEALNTLTVLGSIDVRQGDGDTLSNAGPVPGLSRGQGVTDVLDECTDLTKGQLG